MPSYSLKLLREHTKSIRRDSAPAIEKQRARLAATVTRFSMFFADLHSLQDPLQRNVRRILATKFLNHWYAAFLLVESGLAAEAVVCERAALEALAFHWLVCLDPAAASDYHDDHMPSPVVVRKRLEKLGVETQPLRDLYSFGSGIVHVGRAFEQFGVRWMEEGKGELLIGGVFDPMYLSKWLEHLPRLLDMFPQPPATAPTSSAGAS